ncbi:hypothetical protein V9T40_006149 [Parthenolecanium corni]|uniref:Transcriptional activator protein Pur-beta n=1 Tax=Parthenolecanium corni TaxID=536013 RepID=A0AAN9TVF6_9HEMI
MVSGSSFELQLLKKCSHMSCPFTTPAPGSGPLQPGGVELPLEGFLTITPSPSPVFSIVHRMKRDFSFLEKRICRFNYELRWNFLRIWNLEKWRHRQQQQETELATKMLQIQHKRFYLDVKQNRRGRFIKVAEVSVDGRRNQIFLTLSTAAEFRDNLNLFSEYYSQLGPPNPDHVPEDGKLKSEVIIKDTRRYYLDLKENSRGRFLRVSQTILRGGPRSHVAIPAQGMIEFRDALTDLLEEFGTDDGGFKGELPEGRHMRVDNKNFYFDIGQNNRGVYMRISEVKTNFRTAITVPEKSWARFRDYFADYCDKMKENAQKDGDSTGDVAGSSSA